MNDRMLIHLTGPMMSFADTGYGQIREAGGFPGRSMVLGFVAAALGIERNSPGLLDLHRSTRIHVATISQGAHIVDYQTVLTAGYDEYDPARYRREGLPGKNPTLTWRSYQLGAHHLVCIESQQELGEKIRQALGNPVYVGYLGRRNCPPTTPLLPVETEQNDPIAALIGEIRQMYNEEVETRFELMAWSRGPGARRRLAEEGIDIWFDGEIRAKDIDEKIDATIDLVEYGERRDMLTSLPRSYSARTYTRLRATRLLADPLPEQPFTNEEAFDDAP